MPDFIPNTIQRDEISGPGVNNSLDSAIAQMANTPGGDEPTRPTKWNNRETRSQLQQLKDEKNGSPDFIPVSANKGDDFIPNTSPDFIPAEKQKRDYSEMFPGDFTGNILSALEKHVNDTTEAFKSNPAAAGAGLGYGITAGIPQFLLGASDIPIQVIKGFKEGKSLQEMLKAHQDWNEEHSKAWKQAVLNVASLLGDDFASEAKKLIGSKEFDQGQSILGAPMAIPEGMAQTQTEHGNPNFGAGINLAGETAFAGLGLHGMMGKEPPKPIATLPPEIPGRIEPTLGPPPGPPDMHQFTPSPIPEAPIAVARSQERGTVPYQTPGDIPPRDVGTSPGAAPERPTGPENSINYDPLVEQLQGEAATPLNGRLAVDAPLQLGLPLEDNPGYHPSNEFTEHGITLDPKQEFERAQRDLFGENEQAHQKSLDENSAWAKRQAEKDAAQKRDHADESTRLKPLDEGYEPSQSSTPMERSGTPRKINKGTFGQSGSGDIFNDLGKAMHDAAKDFPHILRKLMQAEFRFVYGPQEHQILTIYKGKVVDDHTSLQGALETAEHNIDYYKGKEQSEAFQNKLLGGTGKRGFSQGGSSDWFGAVERMKAAGKTWNDTPKVYELGDAVRLASGKSGVIIGKQEQGYQIRIHPRDGGGFDFVPASGILNRSLVGGVGKKGFNQGGASNFFGPKKEGKSPKETIETFGLSREPTKDFMERVPPLDRPPERGQDINFLLGESSASFRSSTPFIRDPLAFGNKVMQHVESKFHEAFQAIHALNFDRHPIDNAFNAYYGLKIFQKIKYEQFKVDLKQALDWEKHPENWGGGEGKWYPSGEDMVRAGMKPESAAIWRQLYDNLEQQWHILVAAATINGRPLPPRIPGYLPHVWKGPYSIILERAHPIPTYDQQGNLIQNTREQSVGEYNYYSRGAAKKAMEAIKKTIDNHPDGAGVTIRLEEPSAHGSGVQEILDGMWRAKDRLNSSGITGLENLVKAIYETTAKGIVTSILDRSNPNKIGHLLERVNAEGETGLSTGGIFTHNSMKDAMKLFQDASEAVNEWYGRAKLVNETIFPLDAAGYFDHTPNLKLMVKQYMENFFKIPDIIGKDFDIEIRDQLIKYGLDPNLGRALAAKMNGGFALYYLAANASFYIANSLQFTVGVPAIAMIKAFGLLRGEKTGSILKALLSPEYKNAFLLDPKNELVQYAAKNGHIDPVGMEHLQGGQFQDFINMGIERRTRMTAFNLGYAYAKQIMSKQEALALAGRFADLVSVPYSKQLGAPSLLARLPIVGTAMTMFLTYQQHQFGLIHQQFTMTKESVKAGNAHATAYALGSMVGLQAMNVSLFGLGGLVMMDNWNDAVHAINNFFKTNFPNSQDMGRHIDKFLKDKGIDTFHTFAHGAVSENIGYNISSSGSGASMHSSTAVFEGIANIVAGAVLLSRELTGYKPPTKKETWEWARQLPKSIQGPLEFIIKEKHFGDVLDKIQGKMQDTTAMKDINDDGIPRTPRDTLIRLLTGLKSTSETAFNSSVNINTQNKAQLKAKMDYYLQWLKENPGPSERKSQFLTEMAREAAKDPASTIDSIMDYRMKNKLKPDIREGMGDMNSLEGMMNYKRYLQERQMEK